MTDLVPSVSIEAMLLKRDAVRERLEQAHALIVEADAIARENHMGGMQWAFRSDRHPCVHFCDALGVDKLLKHLDGDLWGYLLAESGMRSLMSAEARNKWDEMVTRHEHPEVTRENVEATFAQLHEQRGEMFLDGVVAVFRKLSWNYKTNTPHKFGRKLVIRYAVSPSLWRGRDGKTHTELHANHSACNHFDDLERVAHLLENKPEPDHRHGCYMLMSEQLKTGRDLDFPHFTLRVFKNGNGHLTFKSVELVDRLNSLLAQRYPNALPPAMEAL